MKLLAVHLFLLHNLLFPLYIEVENKSGNLFAVDMTVATHTS